MHHNNWSTLAYMPSHIQMQNSYGIDQNFYPISQITTEQMPQPNFQEGFLPYTSQIPMQTQEMYSYPQNLQTALDLIEKAVSGESEDRAFYQYLINDAPNEQEKNIIRGIQDDEIKHAGLFRQIYSQLTGRMLPVPDEVYVQPPPSYCEGIKKALMGEQNAVDRYRRILFAMQNRIHVNMLTEIITDELRHGILYNYLFTKNNCRV